MGFTELTQFTEDTGDKQGFRQASFQNVLQPTKK
jgi:hypothetical protein